jgi:hypothetical protein
VISHTVYDDPEVQDLINSPEANIQAVPFENLLKGFEEERFQLWRVGRKKATAVTIST